MIRLLVLLVFITSTAFASETGKASWYTGYKTTASGERFSPNSMTAAHKSLPFGTKVKVTYGSKSIVVRINNRGPFIRGRIIDLTPYAAKQLGMYEKGVAKVTISKI